MAEGHRESKRVQINFVMQKGTQPNRTSSEGYNFLLLYVTGAFLCIWGVLIGLD